MSRPPASHNAVGSPFQQPVIDFVNKPHPYVSGPYGYTAPIQSVASPYHPEASIYAQAGFPGYTRLADSVPGGDGPYPALPPPPPGYPVYPVYEPPPPTNSSFSEDQIKEKINSKIDAIIEAQRSSAHEHRTEQLGSQIERLTRKVQKLSSALEQQRGQHTLSSGFPTPPYIPPAPLSSSMPSLDADDHVSDRLRRLAAESRMAAEGRSSLRDASRDRVPDW